MTTEMQIPKPLPLVDAINKPFWDAAARHELVVQKCMGCSRHQYPPLVLCPDCSSEFEWVAASGRAELYTFTIIHLVFHPAFAEEVPYNVAVVKLAEGPLFITNIVGMADEDLEIGLPLEVIFEDVDEGVSIPKFKPTEAAQ